jgi:protein SCO1/2
MKPPTSPVTFAKRTLWGWLALTFIALAYIGGVAADHAMDEVQSEFRRKEKYFQPIDKPAPDFALTDAEGRAVNLESLRGKIKILHFIYASCPDVCPLHADLLAEVQALTNRGPLKDRVIFLSITTDPARDTPQVLRAYGPVHGLDPANWMFLTAKPGEPEDKTRRLAQAFGHKFIVTGEGTQVHGIVTHVIDQEGRWRANFHGLDFAPTNLVLYLAALNVHAHPP